ncbi:MAG: TonB-dependent receptor family protein [Chitinophagaceae bacterium]
MRSLLLFIYFIPFFCIAQEVDTITSLPSVQIIGKKINRLPGSGQVIDAKKLALLNQTDINKVLRTVPGVYIRDEEGFGLRPNIGLRGTQVNRSAKITLMEDGVLMAPAPYADPSAYYFPTFARMDRVEVLKGSSQIKYGPYTIGGAINLVSTPFPSTCKTFVQVSVGSFQTNQQRIWVGNSTKNIDFLFEINRHASTGFKEIDGGGNSGFDRRDILGKIRWHSTSTARVQQSVTLKMLHMAEDGNESYLGLSFEDFNLNPNRRYAATQKDKLAVTHKHITLNHTITLSRNSNLSTTGYLTYTYRDWGRVNSIGGQLVSTILANPDFYGSAFGIMRGEANGPVVFQNATRTFWGKGVQSTIQYKLEKAKIKQLIQLGVRLHTDKADRFATQSPFVMSAGRLIQTSTGVRGNSENQIRIANTIAVFIQDDIKWGNLTVSPGLRYENILLSLDNFGTMDSERLGAALKTASNHVTAFLPGVGINYIVNPRVSVFGGIHKGFSPPGMPSIIAASQAKPEKAWSYEAGIRTQNDRWNIQLAGFMNQYENILGSDNQSGGGAGTGDMFNAGNANTMGIEWNMETDIVALLSAGKIYRTPISVTYTYTHAVFSTTFSNAGGDWGTGLIQKNDRIPFLTPHLLTVSAGFETNRFNSTVLARFTGLTRIKPGQDNNIQTPENGIAHNNVNALNSYWVIDISSNYKINAKATLFATLNNVLNATYIVANLPQGYRPGMPIAVMTGVKVNF